MDRVGRQTKEGTEPMRLTLRTLLAWLDDTLPPAEVRQIGKQVSESPFAKELVDRIHRVTRQRRLTVPSQTGPDAIDPTWWPATSTTSCHPTRWPSSRSGA